VISRTIHALNQFLTVVGTSM